MKTIAVLDFEQNEFPQFKGNSIYKILAERLLSLPEVDEILLLFSKGSDFKLNDYSSFQKIEDDEVLCWHKLVKENPADNYLRIYADSLFLDLEIVKEMFETHTKYLAEYTYAENLPVGLSCEFFSKELFAALPEASPEFDLTTLIKKNINQFDVELYYKAPDLRKTRLNFKGLDARNLRVMEILYDVKNDYPLYSELEEMLKENLSTLYLAPSYVELEITGQGAQQTIYSELELVSPKRPEMSVTLVEKILQEMREIALPYALCLGGTGEPLTHSAFYQILELILAEDLIEQIIIETDGRFADTNFINFLETKGQGRVIPIISINGYNKETYQSLHQSDDFALVYQNIKLLKEKLSKPKAFYLEIQKIKETEEFLDQYYDFWEKENCAIILQKQNTYLNKLKDRRYSDLSPLKRFSCWHLQRDLFILSDGRVPFCKQDLNAEFSRGDLNKESIQEIWQNSEEIFQKNFNAHYQDGPDCASCDEWYTFNL